MGTTKIATYIIMMTGITLLFYFTGLMGSTEDICSSANPNNQLLCLGLNPEDIPDSGISIGRITGLTIAALELVLGAAIVVGLIYAGQVELAIFAPFAIFLMNLLWNFLSVFNKIAGENYVVAVLLLSPFLIYLAVAILDWWRGKD